MAEMVNASRSIVIIVKASILEAHFGWVKSALSWKVGMINVSGMSLKNLRIVLVSPLYSGNVGSVCRAMKNMGFSNLAVVAPNGPWDLNEVKKMAIHAGDLFDKRKEFPTLAEAVAYCGLVIGTTARRGLYREHAQTPREFAPRILTASKKTKVAIVFGPEDNGLSNENILLCTHLMRIPSSTKYASLNLAQAVMVCCYELYVASGLWEPVVERSAEAPSAMRERMYDLWREALLTIGFMEEDKADHMMLGLKRVLGRGLLTEKDIRILTGMARQTRWAGDELRKVKRKSGYPS
jgi:tRNA/rRNA methyltransferase